MLQGKSERMDTAAFNFHGQSKNHISPRLNLDESMQLEIIL